jgi:hypothetical protein
MTLPEKLKYCEFLAQADMLPANYSRKPANVLVALELGQVLGLAPITTLLEVYVVNNRPSMSARLMATLARKAGHRVETISDESSATTTVTRRDTQQQYQVVFAQKDAQKAGLLTKDGPWKSYPQRMYEARSIAACVRLACPEVLMGVSYTPEELGDDKAEFVAEIISESSSRPAEEPGTAKSYGNIKVSEAQPAPERKPRASKKAADEQQAPPAAPPAEEQPEQPKSEAQAEFEASLPENDPKPASVQQINDAWEAWKKVEGFDPETGEHIPGRDKQRLEEITGITSLRSLTVGQVEQMKNHLAAMAASF